MFLVKIKTAEELSKLGEQDSLGDWVIRDSNGEVREFWVEKSDVGKVIDVDSNMYAAGQKSERKRINWAVEYILTREEHPEYYL